MKTTAKQSKKKFDYRTIQTVDDAFRKQNLVRPTLEDLPAMIPERLRAAWLGVYELFIVFEAINDVWVADFTNANQWKYYPWQKVNSAGSGFVFSFSYYHFDHAFTTVGSRLCTYDDKVALYIGKQFAAQYEKFFL